MVLVVKCDLMELLINKTHFSLPIFRGWLHCVKCNYQTCCERAQFRHGVDCNGNFVDAMEVNMPQEMHCICGFATGNGNKMAQHLANCGLSTCYPSLEAASENAVKRNMLDMLGLVRRDGETSGEGADLSEAVEDSTDQNSDILPPSEDQQLQQHQQVQEQHVQDQQMHEQPRDEPQSELQPEYLSAPVDEPVQNLPVHQGLPVHQQQPGPIQFGEMEAAPVIMDPQQQQVQATPDYAHVSVVQQHQQQQQPYGLSNYGQSTLATDIDMPLIGELSEPNAPPTPQFLGEVHTPMFDAVAAAEQQHYHAQHQHHHHPQ